MSGGDRSPATCPVIPGFAVRPLAMDDAAAWTRYAVLPEVKQLTSSTAASLQDVEAVIAKLFGTDPASPVRFAIVPDGEAELVATVGFHTISPLNLTAEVTYDVAPSHWGRGIATAACRAAVAWGFDVNKWLRIQATTLTEHAVSQRILQQCGFQREGLLRNFRIVRGKPADFWMYSILPPGTPRDQAR